MNQLTFNNQQLLFVKVPMDVNIHNTINGTMLSLWDDSINKRVDYFEFKKYAPIGTIQKEKGVVSTTIEDELLKELSDFKALDGLLVDRADLNLISIVEQMEDSGLPLQEGDKYVVLKIK